MTDIGDNPGDRSPGETEGDRSAGGGELSDGESPVDDTTLSSGGSGADASEADTRDRPSANRHTTDPPAPTRASTEEPALTEQPIRWYLTSTNGWVMASRDILTSLLAVAVIGLVLFAISGVRPPLVAVESGSMVPNQEKGDLIFLVEADRYHPAAADENGIVTTNEGRAVGHESFNKPGNVIVYKPDGREASTPIIHRARFYVEEGENWYDRAEPEHMSDAQSCAVLTNCPAPHDGYVTKGDANGRYDQVGTQPQSTVVKVEWVEGKAVARVPLLGCIRLELTGGASCLR